MVKNVIMNDVISLYEKVEIKNENSGSYSTHYELLNTIKAHIVETSFDDKTENYANFDFSKLT